jgi:hypothetical protein
MFECSVKGQPNARVWVSLTDEGKTIRHMRVVYAKSWRYSKRSMEFYTAEERIREIRAAMPGTSDPWLGRKWAATQVW